MAHILIKDIMQNRKKDIRPRNINIQPHGYWEIYHRTTNNLWFKNFYVNGIEYGYNITNSECSCKRTEKIYYAR